ncbi:MAG TPA: Zn-ribbon domain-containing OB-fold protein [Candidatus Deferrimicrobiaceae bacterium]|nr:Zn-ribbon domain-containing OB-fold protein [Candidatus Deferrimicrobiaceae bacterium]
MAESARKILAPTPTPETAPFWDAAAKGRLLVKSCVACGRAHHYPRPRCPFCGSDRTEWKDSAGRGTIYSFSVMRRATPPYVIAYVTLDEGPTMMTNLVDCDFDGLRIGQPVRVVWTPTDGGPPVPMFTPR